MMNVLNVYLVQRIWGLLILRIMGLRKPQVIVLLCADFQDPVHLIADFVKEWTHPKRGSANRGE